MAFFGLFGKQEDSEVMEQKKVSWELRSSKLKTLIILIFLFAEIAIIYFVAKSYGLIGEGVPRGHKVAIVDFNEPVTQKFVNKIMENMDKVKEDKEYHEVLFVMNSPGGSPTASEELSEYLKDYTKEKNVTMYIQGMAASGGYYIASAIKPLIANKNAIVGSIGVILPHFYIGELAKKIGIEEDDLSSGEYKKPISLFKRVGEKDRMYIKEQLLTPTYNNFINSVATNRNISREKLLPYTEGKIFIANDTSIKDILIDEVLVFHRVKARIEKRLGKEVSFVNVMPKEGLGFLQDKIEFKFSLDTGFDEGLR